VHAGEGARAAPNRGHALDRYDGMYMSHSKLTAPRQNCGLCGHTEMCPPSCSTPTGATRWGSSRRWGDGKRRRRRLVRATSRAPSRAPLSCGPIPVPPLVCLHVAAALSLCARLRVCRCPLPCPMRPCASFCPRRRAIPVRCIPGAVCHSLPVLNVPAHAFRPGVCARTVCDCPLPPRPSTCRQHDQLESAFFRAAHDRSSGVQRRSNCACACPFLTATGRLVWRVRPWPLLADGRADAQVCILILADAVKVTLAQAVSLNLECPMTHMCS